MVKRIGNYKGHSIGLDDNNNDYIVTIGTTTYHVESDAACTELIDRETSPAGEKKLKAKVRR